MSDLAIIFLVLGAAWLLLCLASIVCVLWLERRDARRPPILEHDERYFR